MKKKALIAAILSLTLVFGACGSTKTDVAHNHATEITTEVVAESATEMNGAIDSTEMDVTESTEDEKVNATEVATKDETNSGTSKNDTTTKNPTSGSNTGTNKEDSNTGNTNSGNTNDSNNSGSNTGTNTGGSKPGATESTESEKKPEKDTEKPVTPEKDTGKPAPDTEKPIENTECKHTGKTYLGIGTGDSHAVLCWDCDEEIRRESCDFTGGVCKCGLACNHMYGITEIVESTDKSGRCGWSCNKCGFTSLLNHNVYWTGDYHACTRCSTTWACTHGNGANLYWVRTAAEHESHCNACQAMVSSEPHTMSNGTCGICGYVDPYWVPETEAPAPEPEPTPEPEAPVTTEAPVPETPVVEDGVTSVEVGMIWKRVCRHQHG